MSLRLNLGCGENKLLGFINVDSSILAKPEVVANITYSLPFKSEFVHEVWMTHVIEHIHKKFHVFLFLEINRILKLNGRLILAYPEFKKIAQNWIDNKGGKREWWENTIFGLHRWEGDEHVTAADSTQLMDNLRSCGFQILACDLESEIEDYNTIMICQKVSEAITREQLLGKEIYA